MSDTPFTGEEESVMTRNFLCCLYWESRNTLEVSKDGMRPREIYDKLGSEGITGENLKNQRSNILVQNNLKCGHITRNESTGKVKMTEAGNNYCYSNCGGAPAPD
jgi:hypothetical protein